MELYYTVLSTKVTYKVNLSENELDLIHFLDLNIMYLMLYLNIKDSFKCFKWSTFTLRVTSSAFIILSVCL